MGIKIINLLTEGQTLIEEIRLSERNQRLGLQGSNLETSTEFFSCSGKCTPIGDIEIALIQFGETDQTLVRVKSETEIQRTRALFLHDDIEVFSARYERIGSVSIDFFEILKSFQSLLTDIHANGVEYVTGR